MLLIIFNQDDDSLAVYTVGARRYNVFDREWQFNVGDREGQFRVVDREHQFGVKV